LARLVDAFPENVQIAYRHFPLTNIHDKAHKAAEASEAAGAQGRFWEFHDALYENQSEWAEMGEAEFDDFLIDLADDIGLDTEQFSAELENGTYADLVSTSEQEAIELGLPGTPSIILDGQPLPQVPFEYALWEGYVNSQIALADLADRQYDAPPSMMIDPDDCDRTFSRVCPSNC